jgi:hypothetical protein
MRGDHLIKGIDSLFSVAAFLFSQASESLAADQQPRARIKKKKEQRISCEEAAA